MFDLGDGRCLLQTVDFFTPIVDSGYWFGQIAAANALSDVYAMGGTPITALNLLAWPAGLSPETLAEVLRGGAEKVTEAGAALAGGHSIDDAEPKYGLAVTGIARPTRSSTTRGARAGDRLVLTKRLGIGVLATALKRGLISEDEMMPAIEEAAALNAAAAQAMKAAGAHACTDVTGFGLLGHLREMLEASGAAAEVFVEDVPVRPGVHGTDRRRGLRRRPARQPRLPGTARDRPGAWTSRPRWPSSIRRRPAGCSSRWRPRPWSGCTPSSPRGAPKAGPSARSCMGRPARWRCCERRDPPVRGVTLP